MDKRDQSDLGKQIEDLVQDAIDTLNFDQLSKNVGRAVNKWNEELDRTIKPSFQQAKQGFSQVKEGVSKELKNVQEDFQTTLRTNLFGKKEREKLRVEVPVNKRSSLKVKSILFIVFSSLFLAGFGITTLVFAIISLIAGEISGALIGFFIPSVVSFAFLVEGIDGLKKHKRMMRYIELLKIKGYVDIKELEQYVCVGRKKVLKEVKEMLALGALPEGHLDRNETCLIGTDEIYHQYQELEQRRYENEKLEEERQKEQENMSEEMRYIFKEIEEGRRFIEEIRAVNRDISEPIISEKIARLENISEKIFQYVEENPAKVEEIRRLKNYYLPTMLKLVRTYEKLEDSDVSGANQKKIRTEIEDTLDTMNTALETMYDDLYSAEAMDVSADISVLKTILAREGLVKNELEKTKEEK